MKPKEKKLVVCEHCGYSWKTESKLKKVSCPSCRIGTTNPNYKGISRTDGAGESNSHAKE